MARAACGVMGRTETAGDFKEMDAATTRVRFDLTGEATSKTIAALDVSLPRRERLLSLDIKGKGRGFQAVQHDQQLALVAQMALSGKGVPLSVAVGIHACRASEMQIGDVTLRRQLSERGEAFSLRLRLSMDALAKGIPLPNDAAGETVIGPTMYVVEQTVPQVQVEDVLVQLRPDHLSQKIKARPLSWLVTALEQSA